MAALVETDVLVIGAGGAGTRAAYDAHLAGARVVLATKGRLGAIGVRGGGATGAATSEKGGPRPVGLPYGERLEPQQVFEDIIQCGLGMADHKLVRVLVDDALEARHALDGWGLSSTFSSGFGVKTHGVPIMGTLEAIVRQSPIVVRERAMVTNLLTRDGSCVGALMVDEGTGETTAIKAGATILATGGLGQVYSLNFHPSCVTGDGYALGYEAGAEMMNMEFHQIFIGTVYPSVNLLWRRWVWAPHPRLTNALGEEFLGRYLPAGATPEEAMDQRQLHGPFSTRDSLSRYIDVAMVSEAKAGRGTPRNGVFMEVRDVEHTIPVDIMELMHFRGIHWDQGPVEIGVCHHCCDGGFRIDENGQTSVSGLFAVGEVATGMHGADRMGGHMLLASQVFGARAGRQAARQAKGSSSVALDREQISQMEALQAFPRKGSLKVAQAKRDLQTLAWNDLLVARNGATLERVLEEISRRQAEDLPRLEIAGATDLVQAAELRNGLQVAAIVARAALERKESRGGHHREDYPLQDDAHWLKVVTVRREEDRMKLGTWAVDPDWKSRPEDMWGRQWG